MLDQSSPLKAGNHICRLYLAGEEDLASHVVVPGTVLLDAFHDQLSL